MPSGYTKKRFLGSLRTDGDSDFLYFESQGYGMTKHVLYEEYHSVLSGGTQTTWTNVDCSSFIPADAKTGYFQIEQGATSGTVYVRDPDASRNWAYIYRYTTIIRCGVNSGRNLAYRVVGSGTAYVGVLGYYEDLTY
jgi:hypothetical protein